jgi:hypothetical protein
VDPDRLPKTIASIAIPKTLAGNRAMMAMNSKSKNIPDGNYPLYFEIPVDYL